MSYPSFTTTLDEALDPLVIALDVGSTACRGAIYDAAGRPVGKRVKTKHSFTTGTDGTSTIDPDQVVAELSEILDELSARPEPGRVAGVALDTFASSLVGVDASGAALTPCFTYADSRSADQVRQIRAEIDEERTQQHTGTRQHTSYLPARFRWLQQTQPDVWRAATHWLSLGEYVHLTLLGVSAAGTSTAAWTGMLNRHTAQWDEQMVELAGVQRSQLSDLRDPDQPLTPSTDLVAKRWPSLAEVAWFPAVPDGLASNLGTGALDSRTMVAGASTSGAMRVLVEDIPEQLPSGLWCYRIDAGRSLLGGALNDVGRVLTWLEQTLQTGEGTADTLDESLQGEPQQDTPLVLPFLTGERSTGWAASATATMTGVTASTSPVDLARGAMEGVALSYRRVFDQLTSVATDVDQVRISGSVPAAVPAIVGLMADVWSVPVLPVTIKRSTLHGTALLALESLAPNVERAEVDYGTLCEPRAGRSDYYTALQERFEKVYTALVD